VVLGAAFAGTVRRLDSQFSGRRQIEFTSWALTQAAASFAATLPLPLGGP